MPSQPTARSSKRPSRSAARTSAGQQGTPRAQLPHERDQSSAAQQASTDPIGEKAFDDATSARADTSHGPVTDRVYRKLKSG